MSCRLIFASIALAALGACHHVDEVSGSIDPGLGEAVKYDMAIQVINPDPVYTEEDAQPGSDGAKAAAAVRRYRTDKVKVLEKQGTTALAGPQ